VIRGIRAAVSRGSPISAKVARGLLSHQPLPAELLSNRQREVLRLVAQGLPNKWIATRLGITEGTVKAHLTSIYQSIGVADCTQAAKWAHRNGLADDSD
jgi:DNA-binding NarL/FixJ family response regulator